MLIFVLNRYSIEQVHGTMFSNNHFIGAPYKQTYNVLMHNDLYNLYIRKCTTMTLRTNRIDVIKVNTRAKLLIVNTNQTMLLGQKAV